MRHTETYAGTITEAAYGDASHALFLRGQAAWGYEPLAEQVASAIDEHGANLSVRYFITDREHSLEELQERLVKRIVGVGDAVYSDHYSEITGYLWTDQELNVGGHDLLDELSSHVGQYCHLEITFEAGERK